jgi:hypothetical protein
VECGDFIKFKLCAIILPAHSDRARYVLAKFYRLCTPLECALTIISVKTKSWPANDGNQYVPDGEASASAGLIIKKRGFRGRGATPAW